MSFRFRKSLFSSKFLRVNIGKKGPSLSVGPRGASVSMSSQGTHVTGGIPGTGLSVRQRVSKKPAGAIAASNRTVDKATGGSSTFVWIALGLIVALLKALLSNNR